MVIIDQGIEIDADRFLNDDRIPVDVEHYVSMEQEEKEQRRSQAGGASGELAVSKTVLSDSDTADLRDARLMRLGMQYGYAY